MGGGQGGKKLTRVGLQSLKPSDRIITIAPTIFPLTLPEMSSIVVPSTFSTKNLSVSAPRQLSSGAKSANVNYLGERFVMQTALSMTCPFGLNDSSKFGDAKMGPDYSIDLSFRGVEQRADLKEFMDVMSALDEAMITEGMKNARAWFKMDGNRDVIKAFYTPCLKYSKDKEGNPLPYPPTIKLKLRKYNDQIETKFYDVNGKPYRDVPIEELLVKGVQVTAIMECGGVWFAGSKYGLTWRAKQIAIHKLPEKMGDFAFHGLAAPSAAVTAVASSSSDQKDEVDDDAVFARQTRPSVVAAMLPVAAPVPAVAAADAEEPEEPVQDDAGDDVEPVPLPRKQPLIKKRVVAKK